MNCSLKKIKKNEELNTDNAKILKANYEVFIDSQGGLLLLGSNFIYVVKVNELYEYARKQV